MTNTLENHKPALIERGELAALKKKVEARIAELDEELRPVMEGRGEIVVGDYSFKCTMSAGRKTLDKEAVATALEAHGYKIEDFEKSGAPFTTFVVKAVGRL